MLSNQTCFAVFALACALPAQSKGDASSARTAVAEAVLHAPFAPTADEVFAHVQHLASEALGGRRSGTEHGAAAAAYVAAGFEKALLEPAGDEGGFVQAFEHMVFEPKGRAPGEEGAVEYVGKKVTMRNVVGWLPGADQSLRDEYVLVGAHFDHLGTRDGQLHPGADDNASGTAGLLAIARALSECDPPPRRSVILVAFGAEEQGLLGSRHYARHPFRSLQQCVAMINLDMIGRPRLLDKKQFAIAKKAMKIPDAPAVGVLGTRQSPELAAVAYAVFAADALPLYGPEKFGLFSGIIESQAKGRSDHAPFEQRGIPFLFFSTSEHDDYHQPTDTIDKVDPQTLWRTARCVYRTVLAIDRLDARPTFDAKGRGDR